MEVKNLADLHQDSKNARAHNPRNVGMIVDALREVGAARSGVIDEDGRILAGNATWEALAEAGIERIKVVEADGEEWVVVKRSGLTEEQKRRLALYDNRTAELAEWDVEVLADDIDDIKLLDGLFSPYEQMQVGLDVEVPDFDPVAEWEGMPEFENTPKASRLLIVYFAESSAVIDFAKLIGQGISEKAKSIWFPAKERENKAAWAWSSES
jgi:hypothetical protein